MPRLRGLVAAAATLLALASALPALAAPTPAPTPDRSGEPWWVQVGLGGVRVSDPVVDPGGGLEVTTPQGRLHSTDGGTTWQPAGPAPPPGPCAVTAGPWQLCGGHALHQGRPDPGSPDLGSGAHLLAAPGAAPGVVVAVATDGTVWRRTQAGEWGRSLLLLPDSLVDPHVPVITGLTAFVEPLSDTVYLGVDGYSVLASGNGGDDWIRAGPGLPAHVLGLVADDAAHAVYAGTDDGLWVHHLRALPAPPDYAATGGLVSRQLGTALVTLAGCVGAVMALWWLVARRPRSQPARPLRQEASGSDSAG